MKISSAKAYSLVEIVVASVVFVVCAGAILATVSKTSEPVSHSQQGLLASEFARAVTDEYAADLGANSWGNTWAPNSFIVTDAARFPGYTANVTIFNDGGGRRLNVEVTWTP